MPRLMHGCVVLILLAWSATVAPADGGQLHNVSLTTLGATAKGTGSNFNKDWPAIRALNAGRRGGTIFSPFKGAAIDVRLVVPVEVKAVEIVGLDYHGTRQVSGVDIYIDGAFITHAELPERPGRPNRVACEGRGQVVRLVATGAHPVRTLANGKKGPSWGGFQRIGVLSTTDVAAMMKPVDEYRVDVSPVNIMATGGSLAGGAPTVYGEPRQAEGHPCTIWDQQDIDRYKRLLVTSEKLADQYAGLKRGMDQRMAQPVGVPQPVKGAGGEWTHLPARKYGGAHNQLALDIANLGAVYALSGEAPYGEYAKTMLLAYADVYARYAPGNRPGFNHDAGKCFDQRLGDATWLMQVARGYDLIYNLASITPAERKHIEDDLLKASANFIAANRAVLISPTNWSAIATCSVLITGYATDDEDLIRLALYGRGGTADKIKGGVYLHFGPRCIDADGMWAEGAMGYQFMAMEALVADAEILWRHGIDMYRHRDGAFKRLFDSPLEYAYPDLKTPAIHDSGHGSIIGVESFLWEFGYRRYRDPKYLAILNQAGMHLDAQFQQFPVSVLYDRDADAAAAAPESASVNLFGVGYGVLRNTTDRGTVSLLMDYGPNRSHGHPDKLNIDLWAFGDRLIPDPGSVWYERPMYRRWYRTTLAHNTLCVDELDQRACDGRQIVYGAADTLGVQRASADKAYAGITMDRALFFTPEYMADLFGAFARLPRKMDLCWHVRGAFDSALALKPTSLPEPREYGYVELDDLRGAATDDGWSASFTRGAHVARLIAAGGARTEVLVGDGWLGLERPTTVLQRRIVDKTIYANAVDISGSPDGYVKSVVSAGSLADGYAVATVHTARGADLCFASYRPGNYRIAGLETDAQQAFVLGEDDSAVRAAYLAGGTLLRLAGVELRRDRAGLAYVERADNGAYIVGNPSSAACTLTLRLPALAGVRGYRLDAAGARTGAAAEAPDGEGRVELAMAAGERVEFARPGAASMYEHRQAMLRRRLAVEAAARRAAVDAAVAATKRRETEAAASPVPAGAMVIVQAEDFSAQGGGEIWVGRRKRAAIGAAIAGWDGVGQWLEWTVEVPADGYYHVTFCYCSALALCEREMRINGEPVDAFGPIVFPGTGGWANGSDDWALFAAPNTVADHPLLVKFKAGANTLRLTNLNGRGVNLDYIMVHGADVQPARAMAQ